MAAASAALPNGSTEPQCSSFNVVSELAAVRAALKQCPPPPPPQPAAAAASDDDNDGGELQIWSINLIYGELLTPSVVSLVGRALAAVRTARLAATGADAATGGAASFVDLGSGEGAPPLVAAAAFPRAWASLRGIELVPRLHRLACAHRDGLAARVAAAAAAAALPDGERPAIEDALRRVRFECGDMLAAGVDWPARSDVIFCNGTCYDEPTLGAIYKALEGLSPGAVVILTSHELPQASGAARLFELLHEGSYGATWGAVTARLYRRARLPRWLAGIKP